jgi:hypothetical protein
MSIRFWIIVDTPRLIQKENCWADVGSSHGDRTVGRPGTGRAPAPEQSRELRTVILP